MSPKTPVVLVTPPQFHIWNSCVYIGSFRPGIRSTQLKSSVRMKKTQDSSKWLFLDNLIPEIESKAPN